MIIIKILQRKDAASVVIAISLGLFVAQFTSVFASAFTDYLANLINQSDMAPAAIFDWRLSVFEPTMLLLVQTVVLEAVARIVIGARQLLIYAKTK